MVGAVLGGSAVSAQAPAQSPAVTPPALAGIWVPVDPARSDRYFDVGLSLVPGQGRLTIEQRPDRITVRITMPDDRLDPLLDLTGRFYEAIIYRVGTQGRQGGFGASGPQPPTGPTWIGDRLVIPNPRPSVYPTTTTYSREGERLKSETRVTVAAGRENTVTEWFTKVQ
jgi:hypothetical protein